MLASELSRLLRKARDGLALKRGKSWGATEEDWVVELGLNSVQIKTVQTIHNWLRPRGSSRPPDKALLYIIKECLKAGALDRADLQRLIKELPEVMRAELQPLLPRSTSQDRIVIFNVLNDQPLADFFAGRLSSEFHISFNFQDSPDRFQDELKKATGAIGLYTRAASQDELFNDWLRDVQLTYQQGKGNLSTIVLVHEGSIVGLESQKIQEFQTVYWPRAQAQQSPALERLQHILRGNSVEEESVSEQTKEPDTPVEREDLGAVPLSSRFYIQRATDRRALRTVKEIGGCNVLIKGPRQVGKTSLLIRVTDAARNAGKRVVELNLQALRSEMEDLDDLLYALCDEITEKLKLENKLPAFWKGIQDRGSGHRCQSYLLEHVLKPDSRQLVLALDEVDTVYDKPFMNDFFAMLRAWINESRSSTETGQLLSRLELALVTSTEPGLFIKDYQSPFNVLDPIVLQDFTLDQTAELNQRHRNQGLLPSRQLEQLFALLNGHIYLTRRALNLIALEDFTFTDLMKNANDSINGPFCSHLEALWYRLPNKEPEILNALRQIIKSGKCDNEKILHRLVGAGLVILTGRERKPQARCKLYEIFLKERLRK